MSDEQSPRRRASLRRLSDEEIELWASVARSVARRRGATLPKPSQPKPVSEAKTAPAAAPAAAHPPSRAQKPAPPPLAPIERRLKRELRRGRSAIDDALDLHGLNQAEAHHALRSFLGSAQARGAKLVLVVTGKGKAASAANSWIDEPGVLRRLAPHWLREPDMRAIVLGFEEAGPSHGGSGALYVRIRRRGLSH